MPRFSGLVPVLAFVVACTSAGPASTEHRQPQPEAVMIRTAQPPPPGVEQGCDAALMVGVLVTDPRSGLGLRAENRTTPVVWPVRFSAARIDGVVHLFDQDGRPVAREGDTVSVGGGQGLDDFWHACGGIAIAR